VHPEDAIRLFRRLGIDVRSLSAKDFTLVYYRLARRYHPDLNRNGLELMANINAARAAILKAWRFDG
jgi:curved DNA-binding protein CbpA